MKRYLALLITAMFVVTSASVAAVSTSVDSNQTGSSPDDSTSSGEVNDQTRSGSSPIDDEVSKEIQNTINDLKDLPESANASVKQGATGTSNAAERIMAVAEKLQTQNKGLATALQNVVKNQVEATNQISDNLNQAQNRNRVLKFFAGPNYKALKETERLMEQNQLRIQEMNQLATQVQNEGDLETLQNQIQVLESMQTVLQNQLDAQSGGFSLFGWFFKWIS